MLTPQVKGDLFQQTYELIDKKWGKAGLARVGQRRKDYKMEKWYPFEEYCGLLEAIVMTLGSGDVSILFQVGCDMMVNDVRWPLAFKEKNPGKVFDTNKRQDSQYRVGDFNIERASKKHIRVVVNLWMKNGRCIDLFSEFYEGRLQGILILTGYLGRVNMVRNGEGTSKHCVYDITWR